MPTSKFFMLKIIEAGDGIKGRTRLQKIAFLLQVLQWPIEEEFSMHYYGPYSSELANTIDRLVEDKYLKETIEHYPPRHEYNYELTEEGKEFLVKYQESYGDVSIDEEMKQLTEKVKCLSPLGVRVLELAATLIYWTEWGMDWEAAAENTASLKKVEESDDGWKRAQKIAEEILKSKTELSRS